MSGTRRMLAVGALAAFLSTPVAADVKDVQIGVKGATCAT